MNRYLVCIGEGIGNMVETTPLIDLLSRHGEVHVWAKPTTPGTEWIVFDRARVKSLYSTTSPNNDNPGVEWSAVIQTYSTNFLKGNTFINEMDNLVPFTQDQVVYASIHGEAKANLKQAEKIDLGCTLVDPPESFVNYGKSAGPFDVIVHPGAFAISKAWQGFAELERRLKANGYYTMNALSADLSLPDLAATIRDSDLYIGNDSGTTHVAAAAGTDTIMIFGPTTPHKNRPYNAEKTFVIEPHEKMNCRPCVYQKAHPSECGIRCMHMTAVDLVYDAAVLLLQQKAKGRARV